MDFKSRLLATVKELLSSKKVLLTLAGLVVSLLAKHGVVLAPEDVTAIITAFGVLVGAQGLADFQKSAAIIQAVNPPPPTQTQNVNVDSQPVQDLPRTTSRFS